MPIKKKEVFLKEIIKILDDNKAKDIVTIDLANKSSIADYMIIASGTSSKHIQSVSENTITASRLYLSTGCRETFVAFLIFKQKLIKLLMLKLMKI